MKHCPSESGFDSFMRNVCLSVYGDDNICTVSPEVEEWFHFNSFKAGAAEFGITVTDAAKTGTEQPNLIPLDSMEFLKRNFRREGLFIMSPLNKQSIYKTLGWSKSKPAYQYNGEWRVSRDIDVMQQTLSDVFTELAMHGQHDYDVECERVRNACKGSPLNVVIPSRRDALMRTPFWV